MQRSGLNIWEGPELAKKIKERGKKTKRSDELEQRQ